MSATLLLSIIGIAVLTVLVIGGVIFLRRRAKFSSLDLRLLRITLPREEASQGENTLEEIAKSEQLFSSLSSLEQPFTFEVSVHNVGTSIVFYAAVPSRRVPFVIQQIQGFLPDAQVEHAHDYSIFGPKSDVSALYVQQKEHMALPIRTYRESGVDTFGPLLSNLSKLEEVGDGASVQIVMGPASKGTRSAIIAAIARLKHGDDPKDVLENTLLREMGKFINPKSNKPDDAEKEKKIDEELVKALESKVAKPLFYVNIRLVAASNSKDRAEDLLMALAGSFAQFHAPRRNEFKEVKPKKLKKFLYRYTFREFDPAGQMVLNAEEVASIFHLPIKGTDVPRVSWLTTKESAPPEMLSKEGVIVGDTDFRGEHVPVRLSDRDRRRHMYTIGQTGTGKTTLLKGMSIQDIHNGKGVCIIDPNGDFVDDVLALIPQSRIDDVIVFDPGNLARPLGLNMLEYDTSRPEEKTFIVNEMQAIFNRLFSQETMGPMFEQYMRNGLLLLMDAAAAEGEPATLVEVPRLFSDKEFRKRKLMKAKNPVVVDFWTKEAEKTGGEASLQNITPYITSKFNNFIANDYVRPIIGQPHSAFTFRDVMDSGKILLVKLAKGRIGDINANLLGMIITGKLLMAALSRGDISQDERRDYYFYIDEFQNFTTDSIAVILAEARKYRLNLTVAHQYIAQLQDNIREAVFGNVGSMVSFRIGAQDAEYLLKQFEPEFDFNDLISIENLHAFIKPLMNGEPVRPFNIRIRLPERGSPLVREKLTELSMLTYGKDLGDVERSITERLRV